MLFRSDGTGSGGAASDLAGAVGDGAGDPGRELFDEDAVGELAREPETVPVPF